MHTCKAYHLRHEWKKHSRLVCSHPQYEAETIYNQPTGKFVCTHCGAVLTFLQRASITAAQRRQEELPAASHFR